MFVVNNFRQFRFVALAIFTAGLCSFGIVAYATTINKAVSTSAPFVLRTLDSAGIVGMDSAMAIGGDGYPVIAYGDLTNLTLKLVKCNNATCINPTITTIDPNTFGQGISAVAMAISRDGLPIITYVEANIGTLYVMKCNDASCESKTQTTYPANSNSVSKLSIAIGTDTFPVITYESNSHLFDLLKCNDTACTTATSNLLDNGRTYVGYGASVAIGSDGFPVISYGSNFSSNWYTDVIKCGNSSCSAGNTIQDIGGSITNGYHTSMAIGRSGMPVFISNTQTTVPFTLHFITCLDLACASTTDALLDGDGTVSSPRSLAIGKDGNPIMSYYTSTSADLQFLMCRDQACNQYVIRTLDSVGDVGSNSSIAIGQNSLPSIAYYDFSNFDLKFAQFNSQGSLKTPVAADVTGTYANRHFLETGYGNSLVNDADRPFFNGGGFVRCNDVLCSTFSSTSYFQNDKTVLNSNGLPFASYTYTTGGNSIIHANACLDATCTATTDTTLFTVSAVPYALSESIPQIGGDGFPSVVYEDADTNALEFIHCTNVACTTHAAIVDIIAPRQYHASFAFSGDGFPVMAYDDTPSTSGNLKFTHCSNIGCGSFTNSSFSTSTWGGGATAMIKGSDGKPVIFFSSADGNGVLIKCANYACTTSSSVVLTNSTSSVASISINEKGFPNIVAQTANGIISLFYCLDLACTAHDTNTIFNYADVPQFVPPGDYSLDTIYRFDTVSLAKDSAGLPMLVVSFEFYVNYYAFPYRYLHYETDYVHCDTVRCGTYSVLGNTYKLTKVGGSQVGTVGAGLLGYWTFNGKDFNNTAVADISGNTNNAFFRGGATSTGKTAGKVGQGLNLNGTTNYLSASTSNTLNITTNTMSMAMWVKRATSSSAGTLVTRGTGAAGYSFAIGNPCTVNQVKMTKTGVGTSCLSSFPADKKWHHLALTYGVGGATLYIDGAQVDNIAGDTSSILSASGQTFCIGATCTAVNPFPGTLDEVRIYGYTLADTEVKQLYLAGK